MTRCIPSGYLISTDSYSRQSPNPGAYFAAAFICSLSTSYMKSK